MAEATFKEQILEGIPRVLPPFKEFDDTINHAPRRKGILSPDEKVLALTNALRYFPSEHHKTLAPEFAQELRERGRIYMYRFRPDYDMRARPLDEYPYKSIQAASVMLMIQNNLDPRVAQHPHELIVYGGNGAAFQNWAQYRKTMQYLATMTSVQTLVLNSGHPLGLFPSKSDAPRVVMSNGMVVPNYSSLDDYERMNALGVTQYGQMTAGSAMYIGPQGIVHGTTITLLNAARKIRPEGNGLEGLLFVSSGLGGMSGAQPKANRICGGTALIAEVNPKAISKREEQGWVDELYTDLDEAILRAVHARDRGESISIAYEGNVVDLWERLAEKGINVDLGSDQTSLHNPYSGGYYPVQLTFEQANEKMSSDPDGFKYLVRKSLQRQVEAINKVVEISESHGRKTYFWDYGNGFLLQAGRAEAAIFDKEGYIYPSYVEDIMGPIYFDYGFGPFRWVCTSCDPKDLEATDRIALQVLERRAVAAPRQIKQQTEDNIKWIREAGEHNLVVGSQARILYSDLPGRIEIAQKFVNAIRCGEISAPVVIGRDHHDVSGADSPFRETSNIYDGSKFTADMTIQTAIGNSFRGATSISIHNGGGVGWGEVINTGFSMLLQGDIASKYRVQEMIKWDVNNGLARRSWAGNRGAQWTIMQSMQADPSLVVTMRSSPDPDLVRGALDL